MTTGLLKRLSTKSNLTVPPPAKEQERGEGEGGGDRGTGARPMTAVEQMQALKARKDEMGEDEYEAARQRILQQV